MSTVEEIESAVSRLTPGDLAAFRTWFERFEAERFDQAIDEDVTNGKLDRFAQEALAQHREGRSRRL